MGSPIGAKLLIPENESKRGTIIVQDGTELAALSVCCMAYIHYRGADITYCSDCNEDLKIGPTVAVRSKHLLDRHVSSEKTEYWLFAWTGRIDLDVHIEW